MDISVNNKSLNKMTGATHEEIIKSSNEFDRG